MTADRTESFEAFVRAHGLALARLARLLARTQEQAEDLTQTTLEKSFVRWRSVARADDPFAYVRRILVHAAIDGARARDRRPLTTELIDGDALRSGTDPLGGTSSVDDRAELREWLAELPARQRAVVVLRHYVNLTEAETAELLGISRGAVKTHAHRGLSRLRLRAHAPEQVTGSEDDRD